MNRVATNIRAIVVDMGCWWTATIRAFAILEGSVYPRETAERAIAGEPHYEDEDDGQDAIIYEAPAEWKQAGGSRIVASRILQHAAIKSGIDWNVVTLKLSPCSITRRVAADRLKIRIARDLGCTQEYAEAICYRWHELAYKKQHAEKISREYRIEHAHSVEQLVELHHQSRNKERGDRSEIYRWLADRFECVRERLEDA